MSQPCYMLMWIKENFMSNGDGSGSITIDGQLAGLVGTFGGSDFMYEQPKLFGTIQEATEYAAKHVKKTGAHRYILVDIRNTVFDSREKIKKMDKQRWEDRQRPGKEV